MHMFYVFNLNMIKEVPGCYIHHFKHALKHSSLGPRNSFFIVIKTFHFFIY
uniref:Uncharacterized protein n=1 Tax=Anguilla anguilla TaxID=7936 RepID=A0A0E9XDF4_ANGAN